MRDWRDEEQDRRIEELHNQQAGDVNDIWGFFTYIAIGFVVILVLAGLLDSWFGWGLVDWIWGLVYEWSNGAIGKPNK